MSGLQIDDLLDESLVFCDLRARDMEDLLTQMTDVARERGYVKDSYLEAVLERERLYPTGLPTQVMKVALPHTTDKSHVINSAILVAKLREPVNFKEMGEGETDVPAEMVFMLAVNGPKDQLTILQKVVGMFIKEEALRALKAAETPADIVRCIKANLD